VNGQLGDKRGDTGDGILVTWSCPMCEILPGSLRRSLKEFEVEGDKEKKNPGPGGVAIGQQWLELACMP
jgi:hypothetical protein